MNEKLRVYTKEHLLSLTKTRAGETKLGEKVQVIPDFTALPLSDSKFVLLFLPEDVGVKANLGICGARTSLDNALSSILNIQSTDKLRGDELVILGHLDFEEEMGLAKTLDPLNGEDLMALRNLVSKIDDAVESVISLIVGAGKIPIVVGGGHNNSYPILKALSKSFAKPINTINLDAHSDFRAAEGRHSGNGFRYAFNEGFLGKYCMVGLHENYNSQSIVEEFDAQPNHFHYVFFEDFIREDNSHSRAFMDAINFTDGLCGLEIDLDCISGALTSAMTPTGFSVEQVRDMIAQTTIRQLFYLHIAEGASRLDDGREDSQTGKLIAYLISDFMKAQL